jgi:hypothetical protein
MLSALNPSVEGKVEFRSNNCDKRRSDNCAV